MGGGVIVGLMGGGYIGSNRGGGYSGARWLLVVPFFSFIEMPIRIHVYWPVIVRVGSDDFLWTLFSHVTSSVFSTHKMSLVLTAHVSKPSKPSTATIHDHVQPLLITIQ